MWALIATVLGQELDIQAKRKKHDFSFAGREKLYQEGIKAIMSKEYDSKTHREPSNMISTTKTYISSKDETKKLLVPTGKTIARYFGDLGYIDGYSSDSDNELTALFCNVDKLIVQEVEPSNFELINYSLSREDG